MEAIDVFNVGLGDAKLVPLVVRFISWAIFSYLAIAWLLRFLLTSQHGYIGLISLGNWGDDSGRDCLWHRLIGAQQSC